MNWKNQKGSLLIEVLLSISLAAVFSLAIGNLISSNHQLVSSAKQEIEAMAYAKESMEQLFAIKQSDWNQISVLPEGYYQITDNGTVFQILPSDPADPAQELNGKYYRTVQIKNAYRDGVGNLSESGIEDPQVRRLDVKVEWQERSNTRDITFTSYITNWTGQ
jgi:type II secretory pathway pseudopilin PulG